MKSFLKIKKDLDLVLERYIAGTVQTKDIVCAMIGQEGSREVQQQL